MDTLQPVTYLTAGPNPWTSNAQPWSALSWENVVSLVDAALYAAKHSGRDAWVGLGLEAPDWLTG